MLYHVTWLITKMEPIKYLFECQLYQEDSWVPSSTIEYDIIYVSQKAIKGSAIAEFLASLALDDYQPLDFEFPDKDLMNTMVKKEEESSKGSQWKMYFDGASMHWGMESAQF